MNGFSLGHVATCPYPRINKRQGVFVSLVSGTQIILAINIFTTVLVALCLKLLVVFNY
jgi:hypothetical protein